MESICLTSMSLRGEVSEHHNEDVHSHLLLKSIIPRVRFLPGCHVIAFSQAPSFS